jgi:hypothetical protein
MISVIFQGSEKGENADLFFEVLEKLQIFFGKLDYQSPLFRFDRTRYYEEEMGPWLWRRFVAFDSLVGRDVLADIKLTTNNIEKQFLDTDGNRTVNLDPGLVSLENIILASGKNFTHRIYLGKGVFGEVTLLFQNKRFMTLPWTYPDYASDQIVAVLSEIRRLYSEALKKSTTKDELNP